MRTASFFCSAIFISVSRAVSEGSALNCDQLIIPDQGHGKELTDEQLSNHTIYWTFDPVKADGQTGFNISSLEISFDSNAVNETESIGGVVIQVVPAGNSSEPVGEFTLTSEELTTKSCGESGKNNTVVHVDGAWKNSFNATWVPLVEGDHEVHVSVLTRNGFRNKAKVYEFSVSSSFVTSLFASLMILCLTFIST